MNVPLHYEIRVDSTADPDDLARVMAAIRAAHQRPVSFGFQYAPPPPLTWWQRLMARWSR